jgi:hypothetical protein
MEDAMSKAQFLFTAACLTVCATGAYAQDSTDELAKKLSNPVASLISVPFQFNADFGAGPSGNGTNFTTKVQPVIPFELNADWNVISRTILPITFADDIYTDDKFGLGDTNQSFFFSPKEPTNGIVWGVGPVFLIPTATDPLLGTGKWGAGPTGLVLVQADKWTVGMLASQLWSFAGDTSRPEVNQLFMQPFVSYSLGEGQTLSANLEASYDWVGDQWTVPLNLSYSKVFTINKQPMSWQIGLKKYINPTANSADWGIRTGLTFMFPS